MSVYIGCPFGGTRNINPTSSMLTDAQWPSASEEQSASARKHIPLGNEKIIVAYIKPKRILKTYFY